MGTSGTRKGRAKEAVATAGNLHEYGLFPFSVYEQMRTGLANEQYAAVLDLWQQKMFEQLKLLQLRMTGLTDQVAAIRQDLEPYLRAWFGTDDPLIEQDGLDEPEGVRAREQREHYEALKVLFAQMDADGAAPTNGGAKGADPYTADGAAGDE